MFALVVHKCCLVCMLNVKSDNIVCMCVCVLCVACLCSRQGIFYTVLLH